MPYPKVLGRRMLNSPLFPGHLYRPFGSNEESSTPRFMHVTWQLFQFNNFIYIRPPMHADRLIFGAPSRSLHTLPSRQTFAIKSNQSAWKFAPKTKTPTWPRRPRPGVAGQTESGKSSTSEGNRVPSRPPEPRTQPAHVHMATLCLWLGPRTQCISCRVAGGDDTHVSAAIRQIAIGAPRRWIYDKRHASRKAED